MRLVHLCISDLSNVSSAYFSSLPEVASLLLDDLVISAAIELPKVESWTAARLVIYCGKDSGGYMLQPEVVCPLSSALFLSIRYSTF